jgi:hypothetical protein
MTARSVAIGTIVGGVVFFALGFLVFGIALPYFVGSNPEPNPARDSPNLPAVVVGQLGAAAALTVILGWASASNVAQGAKIGALVGLLTGIGTSFTTFGTETSQTFSATLIGPVVRAALWAAAGAAITAVAGKRVRA